MTINYRSYPVAVYVSVHSPPISTANVARRMASFIVLSYECHMSRLSVMHSFDVSVLVCSSF